MAQTVTSPTRTAEAIAREIALQAGEWSVLPEVERSWEDVAIVDLVADWPPNELMLQRLAQDLAAGRMDGELHASYRRLADIVVANRPVLDRLKNR